MRPAYRKYPTSGPFFVAVHKVLPRLEGRWHYHDEFELAYIVRSRGLRYVGDSIEPLRDGDLILVGPRIPHSNTSARELDGQHHEFIVVHFTRDVLAGGDLKHAELGDVSKLLADADHGLVFTGKTRTKVVRQLKQLEKLRPLPKLATFLHILDNLSRAPKKERRLLSVRGRDDKNDDSNLDDDSSLQKVCRHLEKNYRQRLTLDESARMAAMSPSTFARSFRKATGVGFVRYVTEVRLRRAEQLLSETDLPISEVAGASGFPNVPYFTARFTKERGQSPSAYRKRVREQGVREPAE